MKGVIAWFVHTRVVTNLLLIVILASGAAALGNLKQEVFPEFTLDVITVGANYRGAGPAEVEQAVCVRLEEAVQGIEGIKTIEATASEGHGSMTLEIEAGYDARRVLEDVKANVDAIDTFPEDVERPIVREVSTRLQVINVAVTGGADIATLKRLGEQTRDEITALPGISHADLRNVPSNEISIEVSEQALRRWGLTLDEIANAVRRFSVDLPGGSVKADSGEVFLRAEGQALTGAEYARVPIVTRPDGTNIVLADVAAVIDGFEDSAASTTFNGKPAVLVQVFRVGEQSAVSVSDAVHDYVAARAPSMPDGIEIAVWQDSARILKSRINLLVKNALAGLVLVFVVLALFMRLRLAFWVTLGIPVSFLGAIALMPLLGASINIMSLFAFILVLGIVVDDAIVVGENIHTAQALSGDGPGGAIKGTCEVLVPVAFGVFTTMAAFAPMLFVPGIMGKMIGVFPLIILPTLFFSLVESNLILPCHLSHYKKPKRAYAAANGLDWLVRQVYRPILGLALEWRYVTLAIALVCVLLTVGLVGAGRVKLVLFPTVESENVVAFLTMPREVPAEATVHGLTRIEQRAMELRRELSAELGQDPFQHVLSSLGEHPFRELQSGPLAGGSQFQGEHLGEVNIQLIDAEQREITAEEIASRWREKVGRIPGAVELTISHDLIGGGKAIDLQFSGSNIEELLEVAAITKAQLARYPGVIEVSDTYRSGQPEIKLALTSEAVAMGLSLRDVGRQVRQGFFGEQAQRIQRGRDDVRVMVRYPREARRSVRSLEEMRIRTPAGDAVPLSTIAVASMESGPALITRVERARSINVQANVEESITTSGEVTRALTSDLLPQLRQKFPGVAYSLEGDEADFAESMGSLTQGFFVAMFVVLAMLAIPLKSYVKPAIILAAVPLGMVGAVWGHWILGMEVSFLSMCGMAALAGVVVNDGLVLITVIGDYAQEHGDLADALQRAGEARFRPIVLTSLTTAAGVTPLMLEKSLQAQFLIPMAVALSSGVLFATVITLVLVPASYLVLEDFRGAVRWLAGSG